MRLVSLTCSNTEIVCALGCGHLLVGVDKHSDYPEEVVQKLPRVGPDLKINIDKVAALKPDLVLASLTVPGHEKIVQALQQAGLNSMAPEPISLEDVYRDILEIAEHLGVTPRGQRLVREMRDEIRAAEHSGPRLEVLVEWWPKPVIVPGKWSWVNDLLMAAGGSNPFSQRSVKSTPVTAEEVCAVDPDAVVISWCGVSPQKYKRETVFRREGWSHLEAVRQRRVFCIPEAFLGRPGPRLRHGYQSLCRIIAECQSMGR